MIIIIYLGVLEQQKPSMFRTSIATIMERQKQSADEAVQALEIPQIVDVCLKDIRSKEGLTSQGLFRLSVDPNHPLQ